MTLYTAFRKAVLEEALPKYKEENPNLDYPLEDFLSDFVDAGTDDLFNTYDLRKQLVDVAFPDVQWRDSMALETPRPLSAEDLKAAGGDFDSFWRNFIKGGAHE